MKVILKSGVKFRVTKSEAKAISDSLIEYKIKEYDTIRIKSSGKTFVLSEIAAII